MNIRAIHFSKILAAALAASFGLFAAPHAWAQGTSPCLMSHGPTSGPPKGTVVVSIVSVRPSSDMEGEDDYIPFYDNTADIYGRVTINGEVHNLPKIDEDDFPHWDNHAPDSAHPRGGVFQTEVTATPDPTGMSPMPIPISIEIRESDTSYDDDVDVSPLANDTTLDFTLDLCRLTLSGDFGGAGAQARVVVNGGGGDDDRAEIVFSVSMLDARPMTVDDIALMNIDLIQVLPNVSRLVAHKPTVIRAQVANNYSFAITTKIRVTVTGAQPGTQIYDLPTLGAGEVKVVYLNLANPLKFPERPDPYDVHVTAVVDPNRTLADTGHAAPGDCRSMNNGNNFRPAWRVVATRRPELVWTKVGMDLNIGNFVPDVHFNKIRSVGEGYIRGVYPVADVDQSASPIPLLLTITPGADWIRQIIPYTDSLDPFLMVASLSTMSVVLGNERTMGVLPDNDWFKLFEAWSEVTGLSMGINFPHAVIFLPQNGSPGNIGAAMTLPAHELGHTYRLSTDTKVKPGWACSLEPGVGDLLCGAAGGFDEYKNETAPYNNGNPTNGLWLHQGGEASEIVDILALGQEQCNSNCFMGPSPPNDWVAGNWASRGHWIDGRDYDALFDALQKSPSLSPQDVFDGLIHVAGMVALKGEYESGGEKISMPTTDAFFLSANILPRRAGDGPDQISSELAMVGEVQFLDASGRLLGSGPIPWGFASADAPGGAGPAPLPVTFFGLTYPLPKGAAEIAIAAYAENAELKMLARKKISRSAPQVTLLPPRPGGRKRMRFAWRSADVDRDPLTYTFAVSPDRGQHWWPVATSLKAASTDLDVSVLEPGVYQAMVIASDGVRLTQSKPRSFTVR